MSRIPEPKFSAADTASYVRRLSEMRPEILKSNTDIDHSESAYTPLTDAQMVEGDYTQEIC